MRPQCSLWTHFPPSLRFPEPPKRGNPLKGVRHPTSSLSNSGVGILPSEGRKKRPGEGQSGPTSEIIRLARTCQTGNRNGLDWMRGSPGPFHGNRVNSALLAVLSSKLSRQLAGDKLTMTGWPGASLRS
jgi:hypothetical protein